MAPYQDPLSDEALDEMAGYISGTAQARPMPALPVGLSDEEIDAAAQGIEDASTPDLGDILADAPARLARGAVRGTGLVAQGLGALNEAAWSLAPEGWYSDLGKRGARLGQQIGRDISAAAPEVDPLTERSLLSQGIEGVGTSLPTIGVGLATGGLGLGPAAAMAGAGMTGVAMEAGGGFEEAEARKATHEQALKAAVLTAPAGLLDVFEMGVAARALRAVKPLTGLAGRLEQIASFPERFGLAGGLAAAGGTELAQETLQGGVEHLAQDLAGTLTTEEQRMSLLDVLTQQGQEQGLPGGVAGLLTEAMLRAFSKGGAVLRGRAPRPDQVLGPDGKPLLSGIPDLGTDLDQAGAGERVAAQPGLVGESGEAPAPSSGGRIEVPDEALTAALGRYDAASEPRRPKLAAGEQRAPSVPYEAPEATRTRLSRLGAKVALVDAGPNNPTPGFYDPETNTILVDRHLPQDVQEHEIASHEVVHFMAKNHPKVYAEYQDAIDAVVPETERRPSLLDFTAASREGRERAAQPGRSLPIQGKVRPIAPTKVGQADTEGGVRGPILHPGVAREEAVAETVQQLPTINRLAREREDLLVKVATYNPGLIERLFDVLRDFAKKIGVATQGSVRAAVRELQALIDQHGTSLEKGLGAKKAAQLGLKLHRLEQSVIAAQPIEQPRSLGLPAEPRLDLPTTETHEDTLGPTEEFPRPEPSAMPREKLPALTDAQIPATPEGNRLREVRAEIERTRALVARYADAKTPKQQKRSRRLLNRLRQLEREADALQERLRPVGLGDTVRLPSGETGKVVSVRGQEVKVHIPGKRYGDPDTTLGLPEQRVRTVSASAVEVVQHAGPRAAPLPVAPRKEVASSPTTGSGGSGASERAALPVAEKSEGPGKSPLERDLWKLARRQSLYMGNKGKFLRAMHGLVVNLIRGPLQNVKSIVDLYAGGGTYGLTYAATGEMPELEWIALNEYDAAKLLKLRHSLDEGGAFIDEWRTNPTLRGLAAEIIPLVRTSMSPGATAIDVATGESDSAAHTEFVKWRKAVADLTPRARAALQAARDVMFGGLSKDWPGVLGAARQGADNVHYLAERAKANGVDVRLVSMDAKSPEALRLVQSGGRAFVIGDPPYRGTSTQSYKGTAGEDMASAASLESNLDWLKRMAPGNVVLYHNSAAPDVDAAIQRHFGGEMVRRQWTRTDRSDRAAQNEYVGVYDGQSTHADVERLFGAPGPATGDRGAGEQQRVVGEARGNERGEPERVAAPVPARARLPVVLKPRRAEQRAERVAPAPREPQPFQAEPRMLAPSKQRALAAQRKAALPIAEPAAPESLPMVARLLQLPERAESIARPSAEGRGRQPSPSTGTIALPITPKAGQFHVGDTVRFTNSEGVVIEGEITEATGYGDQQRIKVKGARAPVNMRDVELVKRATRLTEEQKARRAEAKEERELPIQPRFARPTRELDPLGFFSRVRETIEGFPEQIKVASALNKLKSSVSAEELQWSGLVDALRIIKQDDKIERAELLRLLNQNNLEVEEEASSGTLWTRWGDVEVDRDTDMDDHSDGETTRFYTVVGPGDDDAQYTATKQDRARVGFWKVAAPDGEVIGRVAEDHIKATIQRHVFDQVNDQTRYPEYQLPGGHNYREHLLHAPGIRPEFTGGHFGEQPNVLVHMRTNDRETQDGSKVLFVEEIQSDWHQKGRERGYGPNPGIPEAKEKAIAATNRLLDLERESYGDNAFRPSGLQDGYEVHGPHGSMGRFVNDAHAYEAIVDFVNGYRSRGQIPRGWISRLNEARVAWKLYGRLLEKPGVPDAPFKDSWPSLAMKRLLTIAAKGGYTKLAWTTGAQQIDRYNESMRQNVDKIEVEPRGVVETRVRDIPHGGPKTWSVQARRLRDGQVEWDDMVSFASQAEALDWQARFNDQAGVYIRAWKSGQEKFGAEVPLEGTTRLHGHDASLEDVVGKEIARKIREKPGEKQTFEGDGLAIGGKGMQTFYDQRLRDIAKKLTGNEPHTIDIGPRTAFEAAFPEKRVMVHAVDVPTEKIQSQGFPLFALPLRGKAEGDAERFFREQRADIREREKRIGEGGSEVERPLANASASTRARRFAEAVQEMRLEGLSDDQRHTWANAQSALRDLEQGDPEGVKTLRKLLNGEALNEAEMLQAGRLREEAFQASMKGGPLALQRHAEAVAIEYYYAAARAQASGILRNVRDRFASKQERFMSTLMGISAKAKAEMKRAGTQAQRDRILARETAKIQRAMFALARNGFSPSLLTEDYFQDPSTVNRMSDVAALEKGTFWDWYYAWKSSALQFSTLSQARNIVSNASHIAYDNVFARALSGTPAETKRYVYDMIDAVPEALKLGYHTWRWGYREGTSIDEYERAPNYLGLRLLELGSVNINAGSDVFFRHIVAQAELRALARGMAKETGRPMEDFLQNPELIEEAEKRGKRATFTDRDKVTRALVQLRDHIDIKGFMPGRDVVPFVSTPTQIVRRAGGVALGPLVPAYRLSLENLTREQRFREFGRLLVGLGAWAAVYALANMDRDDGLPWVTGSRALTRAGAEQQDRVAPAYSITNPFTGKYMSYQQIDPFGTALAVMVDLLQGRQNPALSTLSTLKDKSFFRGIQTAWEAATDDGRGKLGKYIRGTFIQPMVPNALRTAASKAEDTSSREIVSGNLEALSPRRIAGAVTGAPAWTPPPKYDVWGHEVLKPGRAWWARWIDVMPTTKMPHEIERVDVLLQRYRDEEGKPVVLAAPTATFKRGGQEITMSEREYADFTRDAGRAALERVRPYVADKASLDANDVAYIRRVLREEWDYRKDELAAGRGQ